ncbi:hypothetical protein ABZ840_01455 [Streptomyces sp. NPDC047117]|uniref:hypothetical protein n=1 Tax=unclassified Streptomyces TaxID=2593676 RepID=UPI0033F00A1D
MIRTALRLAAVAVPATALVLVAGGAASAHDDNDFLKSRIIVTKTHHDKSGSGHHGSHASHEWTHSIYIETGMGEDLAFDGD